jgi:uncharacterized protein with FMN-binding domain
MDTTRNATLQDLVTLLQDQHARKLDVVAHTSSFHARNGNLVVSSTEPILTPDGVDTSDGTYRMTDVADNGIAHRLGIPRQYLRKMREERADLYDANVNGWLHGNQMTDPWHAGIDKQFLLRLFRPGADDEIGVARAFLSDRFGIIDNLDVLTSALSGIRDAGATVSIDKCDLTDRRMYVRVSAPEVAAMAPALLAGYRSPFTGQSGDELPVVHAGFIISNSEVGDGAYTITPQVIVQVCSNGMTMKADALRSVHLGSKLDEGVIKWSADTQRKALDLVTARTKDAVATFLDVDYVTDVVNRVESNAVTKLSEPVDTVKTVTAELKFTDTESAGILAHFIKGGQTTAGGVMQAVTSFAQTIEDADRAYEVESKGVEALELAAA